MRYKTKYSVEFVIDAPGDFQTVFFRSVFPFGSSEFFDDMYSAIYERGISAYSVHQIIRISKI